MVQTALHEVRHSAIHLDRAVSLAMIDRNVTPEEAREISALRERTDELVALLEARSNAVPVQCDC